MVMAAVHIRFGFGSYIELMQMVIAYFRPPGYVMGMSRNIGARACFPLIIMAVIVI
jgi:hypothetical protein